MWGSCTWTGKISKHYLQGGKTVLSDHIIFSIALMEKEFGTCPVAWALQVIWADNTVLLFCRWCFSIFFVHVPFPCVLSCFGSGLQLWVSAWTVSSWSLVLFCAVSHIVVMLFQRKILARPKWLRSITSLNMHVCLDENLLFWHLFVSVRRMYLYKACISILCILRVMGSSSLRCIVSSQHKIEWIYSLLWYKDRELLCHSFSTLTIQTKLVYQVF